MNTINDVPKELREDLKTKVAMVIDSGLFVELSKTLSKSFKEVLYFMPWVSAFPKSNQYIVGQGIEGVRRIEYMWDHIDKTDIFVFPDVYFGDLQNFLVSIGKTVWGGRKGEEMELYRDKMKDYMKSVGLYVTPFKVVTGIKDLREYLKAHENVYVKINLLRGNFETFHSDNYELSEPQLDEIEYTLGAMKNIQKFVVEDAYDNAVEAGCDMFTIDGKFPSKILAGIEIKDLGYMSRIMPYDKVSKKITDFNDKMVRAFKRYNYRGFFSTEVRISKDKPPYMLDFCFSDDTEILTDNGWKLIKEVVVGDSVATLNTETKEIEYQEPTDYIVNDYEGKMIELTNLKKSIECLITPNHLVLRTDRDKKKLFKQQADSLTDKGYIPRTGNWTGNNEEYFELPEYHNEWDWISKDSHDNDYLVCTRVKHEPILKILMKDWAALLGWYISEGSTHDSSNGNPSTVVISQTKHVEIIREILDRLPFKYKYNGHSFRFSSIQVATHLKEFGLCYEKFVPDYIKSSSPEIIRIFLDNFNLGDGSIHKGNKVYFTTSKRLADDLQELIFKVGSVCNIVFNDNAGTSMSVNGKSYIRRRGNYTLYEHNKFTDFWFETGCRKARYIKEVDYNGKVYCLTVPNGTVYVRRNGKPFWSSNCARQGSPPSELYQLLFTNLAEIIWYGAKGYVIDPIAEFEYGVEVLIHSAWADKNWQAISFPKKYRDNIKLRNACVIDDKYYCVPQIVGLAEIGAIVTGGHTLQEAIDKVKEIAATVKGYYIDIKLESIDQAIGEFKKLEEFGVKIL